MKVYLLTLSFILSSLLVSAQIQFDSVSVYNDFNQKGYTTAGAHSHFNDLKGSGAAMISLNKKEINSLELLLSAARVKKHWQTKLGIDNIFLVGFENGEMHRLVIAGELLVINLTTGKEYKFTDQEIIQLKALVKNIKGLATTTE